jgi:UDP-2,3-diacylglucosamine hydrolase
VEERAVFLSDVHVDPADPEKTAALVGFLERLAAEGCARLGILGDLFEYWVGRGHEALPVFGEVLARIAALRAGGCEVLIVHGNRDFHMGPEVERATGASVVREGAQVRLGGRTARLAHGDLLCLRDTGYQALRRVIRSAAARRAFLALPLGARLGIGGGLRRRSERSVRARAARAPGTFALVPSAVRRLFRGEVDVAVVGHVHRARRIALDVRGRRRLLFSLGSWDHGNMSWLEWREGRFTLHDGPGGARVLVEEDAGGAP